jgi:hypothetical protein
MNPPVLRREGDVARQEDPYRLLTGLGPLLQEGLEELLCVNGPLHHEDYAMGVRDDFSELAGDGVYPPEKTISCTWEWTFPREGSSILASLAVASPLSSCSLENADSNCDVLASSAALGEVAENPSPSS